MWSNQDPTDNQRKRTHLVYVTKVGHTEMQTVLRLAQLKNADQQQVVQLGKSRSGQVLTNLLLQSAALSLIAEHQRDC